MSAMKSLKSAFILTIAVMVIVSCSSHATPTAADPLTGKWQGEWGPSPERQTEVTLDLKWDGSALTGTINPGLRASEISKATFNPETNAVTMELDVVDVRGQMDHYSIVGKVDGKTMTGTWTRTNGKGTFKIQKM